jgi:hypothetical protein
MASCRRGPRPAASHSPVRAHPSMAVRALARSGLTPNFLPRSLARHLARILTYSTMESAATRACLRGGLRCRRQWFSSGAVKLDARGEGRGRRCRVPLRGGARAELRRRESTRWGGENVHYSHFAHFHIFTDVYMPQRGPLAQNPARGPTLHGGDEPPRRPVVGVPARQVRARAAAWSLF